jgi:hypothetical protein
MAASPWYCADGMHRARNLVARSALQWAPSASTTSPSIPAVTVSRPIRRSRPVIRPPAPRRPSSIDAPPGDDELTGADVDAITARLDRWDAATTPWTRDYLRMIGANEAVRAPDLAARVGLDVPRFKRRVRQLKGLGLTISLDVGYRLSPRGRAYLRLAG